MPVTTEEPIPVPQLPEGPQANYFRVAAFHLGVLATHARGYIVVFEASCQADLITQPGGSWQAVGSWSQVVDPTVMPALTIATAEDYAPVFEQLEAHLIEKGIFPEGERTEV
jgi:hypothetical protein